jgi:hypothetical protein
MFLAAMLHHDYSPPLNGKVKRPPCSDTKANNKTIVTASLVLNLGTRWR